MHSPAKPLHPDLQPFSPTESEPFDYIKAGHLLQRATFGGTPQEISKAVADGPAKTIDALLDFPDAPLEEQTAFGGGTGPDLSAIEEYPSNFAELRKLYQGKTEDEKKEIRQKLMKDNREAVGQTMNWWLQHMATGPYPMQEKLALFWHGHFTTSARDERSALLMWNQNELHRRMAAGNFKKYVHAISRDPAMLDYLNNSQNKKAHPNENYARELMELFTLGRDNGYTEDDIKQVAKCFTGWAHDGDDYVFHERDHDTGPKTIFGRTGNFNGDQAVDIILGLPAPGGGSRSATYIASRLWNYFAYEPTDDDKPMLASLGQLLLDSDWELRPVLKTMFTSKAFYSDRAIGTQIKSPIQLVTGLIRQLGLEFPRGRVVLSQLTQMGQMPLNPPNVKGWPGGHLWINTSTLFVRYNTGVFLAGGAIPDLPTKGGKSGKSVPRLTAGKKGNKSEPGVNFKPDSEGDTENLTTPQEVVDYWTRRLLQRPLDDDKTATLMEALDNQPHNPANVRKMIQLLVSTPDFQLC